MIPASSVQIGQRDGAGVLSGEWGRGCCEENEEGRPPYIGAASGGGVLDGAAMSTWLRWRNGVGEVVGWCTVSW